MSAPNTEGSVNPAVLTGGVFGAVVGSSDGPTTFVGNNFVAASTLTTAALIATYLQTLGLAL